MRTFSFSFFLDVSISYVTFGLAIYAVAGLLSLIWIQHKARTPRRLRRNLDIAYSSIVGLVLLDACRQIWDSFHTAHFPLAITRITLPLLYLLLGNALMSIANSLYQRTDSKTGKQDENTRAATSH